jgi:hypothetical protein
LQPFRLVSPSWLEREMAAAAQIYRLALQSSSNAPLVIYATWVAVATNEPIDQRFHDQMVTAIQVYCEYFVDVMQQEFPSNQVYIVPTGAALIDWTQYPSLTPAQQTYLQQLAWLTMTNHPRTMLSTTPRQKPDMAPPSPPGDLRITNLLADRVTLLWNAATDNVGVTRYTLFTDNEWYANVTTNYATVMLTNVLDPSRCMLKVRAWDADYNVADAQILLPEPCLLSALVFGCARRRRRLPILISPSSLQDR